MKISDYISEVGPEVAAHVFGCAVSTAKSYRNGIRKVDPERVIDLAGRTGWKVTPHEIRPDLYPHPSDGLPDYLRNAA